MMSSSLIFITWKPQNPSPLPTQPMAMLFFFCFNFFVHSRSFSRSEAFIGYSESFLNTSKIQMDEGSIQDEEFLVLSTAYGNVTIQMFSQQAPMAVQYMKSLVDKQLFDGCAFYRAEPPGDTVDEIHAGIIRKGYALVQGGLYSCGRQQSNTLPVESAMSNKKGTISLITGTSEFFINIEDHIEWNGSFTVWGQVVGKTSWPTLEMILSLPTHQELHPSGTVLRILQKSVLFSASYSAEVI